MKAEYGRLYILIVVVRGADVSKLAIENNNSTTGWRDSRFMSRVALVFISADFSSRLARSLILAVSFVSLARWYVVQLKISRDLWRDINWPGATPRSLSHILTGCYQLEETRSRLSTDEIVRPAREGTVIQLGGWRVFQHADAARLLHGEPSRCYLQSLAAVVEFPAEIVCRRIGLDPTGDVERFAPRCTDHHDSVVLAHRRDCKQNYRFVCVTAEDPDVLLPPGVSELVIPSCLQWHSLPSLY